jgi:hypothetical protein
MKGYETNVVLQSALVGAPPYTKVATSPPKTRNDRSQCLGIKVAVLSLRPTPPLKVMSTTFTHDHLISQSLSHIYARR